MFIGIPSLYRKMLIVPYKNKGRCASEIWNIRAAMVDPGRTLGEVAAVTRIPPEFAPKNVKKIRKIYILMSIIQRQIQFFEAIRAQHG